MIHFKTRESINSTLADRNVVFRIFFPTGPS